MRELVGDVARPHVLCSSRNCWHFEQCLVCSWRWHRKELFRAICHVHHLLHLATWQERYMSIIQPPREFPGKIISLDKLLSCFCMIKVCDRASMGPFAEHWASLGTLLQAACLQRCPQHRAGSRGSSEASSTQRIWP